MYQKLQKRKLIHLEIFKKLKNIYTKQFNIFVIIIGHRIHILTSFTSKEILRITSSQIAKMTYFIIENKFPKIFQGYKILTLIFEIIEIESIDDAT